MSFLRKRSRSQCSFVPGEEAISVRKPEQTVEFRKPRSDTVSSTQSSCSGVEASDFAIDDSCVMCDFPKHKSSHLRFLAWTAYTRKYTNDYITEDERRTCPLLWCREVFSGQEAMLKHVWNCQYLSKGLYWCFHCQRPERVGKFQCRRCQGAPSRKDRITSVAKRIFSKLGSSSHRTDHSAAASSSKDPKDLSNVFEEDDSPVPPYFADDYDGMRWDYPDAQELPNNCVIPEMAGDMSAASYELPDTFISEMVGTECPVEMGTERPCWEDNFYAETWDEPSSLALKPRAFSPKLALDTSVGQSSRIPSWTDTPQSATMISPMSAFGKSLSSPLEVSPTDSEASGNTFFTDSGYSSATTISHSNSFSSNFRRFPSIGERISKGREVEAGTETATTLSHSFSFSSSRFGRFPSVSDRKGKGREIGIEIASEQRMDETIYTNPMSPPMPTILQAPAQALDEESEAVHSAGRCSEATELKLSSPHWHDAASLVSTFSQALDAHIQHSQSTLQALPHSSTTQELQSISRTAMVSIALEVLTGILEGKHPTTTVQIFAFIHLACALAIAIDDEEAKVHAQTWFDDSLAWTWVIQDERQKAGYEFVARAVWEPLQAVALDMSNVYCLDGENTLLATCKHFLDIFELLNSPMTIKPPPKQQFDFAHTSFEHKAKSRVIDELIQKPSIEAFIEDVVQVERRLLQGQITSIRELELELMCAGKLSSQSGVTYSRFREHVTTLCDVLYLELPLEMSRTQHHVRAVSQIKLLLPEEGHDYGTEDTNNDYLCDALQPFHADNIYDENDDLLLDLDFAPDLSTGDLDNMASFMHDADNIEQSSHNNHSPYNLPQQSLVQTPQLPLPTAPPVIKLHPPTPIPTPTPRHITTPSSSSSPVTSSSTHRCHCGYIPTGEERWKASNLRRHKRIQHATASKVYLCRWPGCKSSFTRSDNLRCHVREKGH